MDDFTALNKALEKLALRDGVLERNRTVWNALKNNLDGSAKRVAKRFSDTLISEQEERGSHHPTAGELVAAEVLFQTWLLLERGNDGTD